MKLREKIATEIKKFETVKTRKFLWEAEHLGTSIWKYMPEMAYSNGNDPPCETVVFADLVDMYDDSQLTELANLSLRGFYVFVLLYKGDAHKMGLYTSVFSDDDFELFVMD